MEAAFHNLKFQKKKFLGLVEKNFAPEDRNKIITAYKFASEKHKGQRRAEGPPYIIHPIRAAIILMQEVGVWDSDLIVGILLHDVIEDCGVRLATVKKRFGKRVADFVHIMTRPRHWGETEEAKERNKMRHLKKISRGPIEWKLLKCADLLDNMRSASDVPFYEPAWKKFPRWRREFHRDVEFAKTVHQALYHEMQKALRVFELKRVVRGVVRLGR